MVELLVNARANKSAVTVKGESASQLALSNTHTAVAQFLAKATKKVRHNLFLKKKSVGRSVWELGDKDLLEARVWDKKRARA